MGEGSCEKSPRQPFTVCDALRSVSVWRHERAHGGRDNDVRTTAIAVVDDARRYRIVGDGGRTGRRRRWIVRAVRRARGPGGRWRDRRQRAGDRCVPPGTSAPPPHQLLHRVARGRRSTGRHGGHTVRRAVQCRSASSSALVRVHRVTDHRPVHRVHTQFGGRVCRPVLGNTLSDGLLHQLQHQNCSQYVQLYNYYTFNAFYL